MPRAQLQDVELYYETAGSGRPVVLVNSWGTTLRLWDQVIADLSADHQVVAYDWRGCGRSDRTAGGNTIDQNAADLLALIAHLDLDRPVLVGSSVGSLFALVAARTTADRIGGVVVVDGPGHCRWLPNLADVLHAHMRNLQADRAATVAASVKNMYTDLISRACWRNAAPAAVSSTVRVVRWNSCTPSSCSSRRTCWLTAGWTM